MRRKHEYIGLGYMTHYTKTIEVVEKKFSSSSIRKNEDKNVIILWQKLYVKKVKTQVNIITK